MRVSTYRTALVSGGGNTVAYRMTASLHVSGHGDWIAGWRVNEIGDYAEL